MHDYFIQFPISEADRKWGLYVSGSGRGRVQPGDPYPQVQLKGYPWQWKSGRVLKEFALVHVPEGRGMFESKPSGKERIAPGQLLLLFPDVWHRYHPDRRTGWLEQWVVFDGFIPRALLRDDVLSPARPVLSPRSERVAEIFGELADLVLAQPLGYQQICGAGVLQLLAVADAESCRGEMKTPFLERKIAEARRIMMDHADAPLDMPGLARRIGMSYSWFRRSFKAYTGLAPSQYHLQLRIHRARHMLGATDLPIKHIAAELGFESPFYFSRYFKHCTGQSPTLYRRGHPSDAP
jgi:AraC-like DNA-binding protein